MLRVFIKEKSKWILNELAKMKSVNQPVNQSTSPQKNSSHNSDVSETAEGRFESILSFLTRHLRPLSLRFLNHKMESILSF